MISNQGNVATAMYQGLQQQSGAIPAPRTIASAIGRVDGLNERLAKVCEHLSNISDQIGGPRPTPDGKAVGKLPSQGVVGRLNDSADAAHDYIGSIEDIMASISRALG